MPCLHYDCSNRNSFGYCKTTVCINEHYQQEQWGSPSTTNKSESAVIKQQTNAEGGNMMYKKFVKDEILDNGIIKGHMELIKTNADRIRNMSDEELAEFFPNTASEFACPPGATNKNCEEVGGWYRGCPMCWLNWLKQESKQWE